MDDIEMIVTALTAGASAGVTSTMSTAVKDLYETIKTRTSQLLNRHSPAGEKILTEALRTDAGNSKEARQALAEALVAAGAAKDHGLTKAAMTFIDSKGIYIGDGGTQVNNFS